MSKDTGTAVTTIKDCSESTLSSPIVRRTVATSPISNAQNTRNNLDGSPFPVIAIEIVRDMESVVVRTKTIVASRKRNPNIVPNGNWFAIAIIAAGGRSEEHTSELQSRGHLVCSLLLEKKYTCIF